MRPHLFYQSKERGEKGKEVNTFSPTKGKREKNLFLYIFRGKGKGRGGMMWGFSSTTGGWERETLSYFLLSLFRKEKGGERKEKERNVSMKR